MSIFLYKFGQALCSLTLTISYMWSKKKQREYVLYLHWSPNPKCYLVPIKPSGPHIFKASIGTRLLRRGPACHSTPTNPTAVLIIGFLQEDEGEADL